MKLKFLLLAFFLSALFVGKAAAASTPSSGVGLNELVAGADDGSIVSHNASGYQLSSTAYDSSIVGVVSDNPALEIENKTLAGSSSVISSGKSYVLVSSTNGVVNKGDFITSSTTPGVGQKATKNGFVLGIALENSGGPAKILASISPRYVAFTSEGGSAIATSSALTAIANVFSSINAGASAGANLIQNFYGPTVVQNDIKYLQNAVKNLRGSIAQLAPPRSPLRYILAFILALLSFAFGFFHFGRSALRGVDALGENPAAGTAIGTTVAFNVVLAAAVSGAGLIVAYLILIL